MAEFKTLQFDNTRKGQTAKMRALETHTAQGWRVVSETITPGKFKGGDACCLFMICMPCALLAGHADDVITVTLERANAAAPPSGDARSSQLVAPAPFDRSKWNALLQYDKEIAGFAAQLISYGPKWVDELASAFLVLNDKTYLSAIVADLTRRARLEQAEEARQEAVRLSEARVQERARKEQSEKESAWNYDFWGTNLRKLWTCLMLLGIALLTITVTIPTVWTSSSFPIHTAHDAPAPNEPALLTSFHYIVGLNPKGDNWLALRSEPTISRGVRLLKLEPSTLFTLVRRQEDWQEVRLQTGQVGWVYSKYVACCVLRTGSRSSAPPHQQAEAPQLK